MNQTEDNPETTLASSDDSSDESSVEARLPGRRRRLVLWVVLIAVLSVAFYQPPSGPPVGWGDDLEGALVEAKTSERLVVVAFHGALCPPCHVMDRAVLGKPAVQKALVDFVPVRLDPEQHPEAAIRYQIYGTPAYLVLDANGDVVNQIIGSRSVKGFVGFLESSLGMASSGGYGSNTPPPGE